MKLKGKIKEYWKVFCANTYDGKRMEENMRGMCHALMLLAIFSFVMTVINVLNHEIAMTISSLVLCALFLGTYVVTKLTGKHAVPILGCTFGIIIIFTYYILSGGNDGFAVLWTLLAPIFLMIIVGVKAGFVVGVYFQTLVTVLFWTPLRFLVEAYYTEDFLKRFPVLYLCTMVISMTAMLSHKKQQINLDTYQENLEKAVQEEHDKSKMIAFQTLAPSSDWWMPRTPIPMITPCGLPTTP